MKLLPCPFCGSQAPGDPERGDPAWVVHESRLRPRQNDPGALIAVEIRHWCGERSKTRMNVVGRDHDEAERNWNRRAA